MGMEILHPLILYIHILSVIMSIGPFFILLPISQKIKVTEGVKQQAYLDTFKASVRLAKHAGHVLAGSGILLVIISSWTWRTPWIDVTVIVMVSSLFFLARAFSPTLRKFDQPGQNKNKLVSKLLRSTIIYLALLLAMLWLMVSKPVFW
jgi:hypothetical protein